MTIGSVSKGRLARPTTIVLYGPEGCGKTTFAASAPNPVFMDTESGTSHMDVARFDPPETWQHILDAVHSLTVDKHDYKTFVLDTVDHAEPLLWKAVCAKAGVEGIEDVGGGYGKGYIAALDGWRSLIGALERLQKATKMNIVLLAHSQVKPFKAPEADGYDRHELKLHKGSAGLLKEWADAVLFANFETVLDKDKRTKRVKGIATGARVIHTTWSAAYDAKSRIPLPEKLVLDWEEFAQAIVDSQPSDPIALKDEIRRKAKDVGGTIEKLALETLEKFGDNAERLARLNVKLNGKLAEKEEVAS